MKLKIAYFALFREQAKKSNEEMDSSAKTAADLYKELQRKYDFHLHLHQLKVAVNDEFCSLNYELKENDQVVFIPPVAGG